MPYMEQMKSGLNSLVAAGEAGRSSLDGMIGPINGAIGDIGGAATELENVPFVGPEVSAKLRRLMSGVTAAQAKIGTVVSVYNAGTRAVSAIDERIGALKEQAAKAGAAINQLVGQAMPSLGNVFPTSVLAVEATPAVEAVTPFPHLLILQPLKASAAPYFFNLDTAAFDELRRQTSFRWASQERLTRRPAQQSVGLGEEKITLKGAIHPSVRGGLKQLDTLRSIGSQLLPLGLTTGYGEVLGNWCLTSLEEEQSALLHGGLPRKQSFTLEFVRYGDDLQNL